MTLTQTWVGYAARSYEVIKRSLLDRLGGLAPEINDHSESNPLIILISQFAGVAEVIHLYLDAIAREAYIGTARRYESVVKLAQLVDYQVQARNPASVDLLFTLVNSSGDPVPAPAMGIIIAKGTEVRAANEGLTFRTTREVKMLAGNSHVYAPAEQFEEVNGDVIGTTSGVGLQNQAFDLSDRYVHESLRITIAGEDWPLYKSFGQMDSTTKGAVVVINQDRLASLVFGDGTYGQVPPNSENILGNYRVSDGATGNLPPGNINELLSTITTPGSTTLTVTNPDYSSGGQDFEGIEDVRKRAPLSIRTLDRAVTYQDYVDLAELVPGVGAAEVQYCCGKYVDVFIVPNSRGAASQALVAKVKQSMDCKVMLTTKLDVKPAGNSRVYIKATIIGKPLAKEDDIREQVYNAWDENFGYDNLKINRRVSITDIIAVTEQLSLVDTIEIEEIRVEPYARPSAGTSEILDITWNLLPHTTVRLPYKLIYKTGIGKFQFYKNGLFVTNIDPGVPYTDGSLVGFTLNGTYNDNATWEFQIHPSFPDIFPTTIIEIKDFSAAVIDIDPFVNDETVREIFGDVTIEETAASSACMPSCS